MSSSTASSKDSAKIEERRSYPREKLKRYVVLVFFGEDNWGKLTNMSESGMAFEFAKPPSMQERVTFTFQAMGCMPMPRNEKALCDSFEAPGKIVWTREFERGAGVQFVDLAEASREQIHQWLSFETSTDTVTPAERAKPEKPPVLEELAPLAPASNTPKAANKKETLIESDRPEPLAQPARERESAFRESPSAEEPYQAASREQEVAALEPRVPQFPVYSHSSVARLTLLVVSGCLAAFALTAGARILMTRAARRAVADVAASDPTPRMVESAAEVNVSSPVPAPVSLPPASVTSSSAVSAPPFQVDVRDADGRSWILWFVRGGAKDKESQLPYRLAQPSRSSASTVTTTSHQEGASPEKLPAVHTFTMVAPNVTHPLAGNSPGNPSGEVPAIQPELTPSSEEPFGGTLSRQVAPAAPATRAPIGGRVQEPRLIRSVPPAYPQLAKSIRVSGDVVVDALIDTAGNVTAVKVISGPDLLHRAAMETVGQWKYEPARLDGQAVAMHLSLTVRFRLN